jgi:hypothetical protein
MEVRAYQRLLLNAGGSTALLTMRAILVLMALLIPPVGTLNAQTGTSGRPVDPLYEIIASLDTTLFDAANRCALDKLGTLIADDLEFYHDRSGLAVGKQVFLDSVKNNTCGKMIRELVPGSLEVYPLGQYGAVEIGIHRFHHPGHDGVWPVGEAKFIHIWQHKDGAWKLSRVISYSHK